MLDRLVSWLSPSAGLERIRARRLMATAAHWSASSTRRGVRTWKTSGGSAVDDINDELPTLRRQSRDLVRNNPVAAGAVNIKVSSVVGAGLTCSPYADGVEPEAVAAMEAAWREYAEGQGFSACGTMTAHDVAALAYRSMLESGDVLLVRRVLPRGVAWQIVEGDRLCNEGHARDGSAGTVGLMYGGVELGELGEPLAYWITRDHPGSYNQGSREWDRIPATDDEGLPMVVHLLRRRRPGQVRGTPDLTPVIEALHKLGKFCDAELDAAVTGSFLSLAITSQNAEGLSSVNPSDPDEMALEDDEVVIAPNEAFYLRPGEDIKQIKAEHPSNLFDPFVQALLRQIGAALSLPFEVLVKHFQSSYSASRAAILDAWREFTNERAFIAARLYDPWFRVFVAAKAMASGESARGWKAEWAGTSVPQLDPVDEITAARRRIELGISSRTIETAQLTGRDWHTVIRQKAEEDELMRELGMDPLAEMVYEGISTTQVKKQVEGDDDVIGEVPQ